MGPSSEGSRAHERGTKTLSPRGAPLCTSHHHSNSLHWPCILCVSQCVCLGKKRVCSCLYKKAGAAPWDFCIMDLSPLKWLCFQLSFLNRLHSPAGTMHLLLSKSIFLRCLLCILTTMHHALVFVSMLASSVIHPRKGYRVHASLSFCCNMTIHARHEYACSLTVSSGE